MNLSPAAAQAALDYAEELAATGLSTTTYISDKSLPLNKGYRLSSNFPAFMFFSHISHRSRRNNTWYNEDPRKETQ